MLVDSHCHLDRLDLTKYDGKLEGALDAARDQGITNFLNISITLENFPDVLAIAEQSDAICASVGLHPTETDGEDPTVERLIELAQHPKVVAIGETGLDYYRCEGDMEWQKDRFRTHIRAARELKLPLIIHTRLAPEDTIRILKEEKASEVGGVFHCFTESWDMAKQGMDLGFYISISGIVTFKNAHNVQEVATKVPLDMMLVETDAPYLAPMPYRGKPNEPAYVRYTAEKVAELKKVRLEEVAQKTTNNYFSVFNGANCYK